MAGNQPKKVPFTKATFAHLKPIPGKRQFFYDAGTPGLALCVLPTGKLIFYLVKRINGRSDKVRIGAYPELTIYQARTIATKMNGEIADGGDPQARKRAVRTTATLGDVFDHYRQSHLEPHSSARSLGEDVRRFKKHLTRWRNRPVVEIQTSDVARLHTRLGKDAPVEANRVLTLLRRTVNHGKKQLGVKGDNPTEPIKKYPEQSRDRFLDGEEIKRLFMVLADDERDPDPVDEHVRDFILLALFTGARKTNLENMRWTDIDLKRGLWKIGGGESKNKMTMLVVLPDPAIEILQRREHRHAEFVFRDEVGRLPGIKNQWKTIRENAHLEDLTLHDLRRTHGAWQAATGASLTIIGKSLGHKSLAATQVYARLDTNPVRESVVKATTAMLAAANGGSNDE